MRHLEFWSLLANAIGTVLILIWHPTVFRYYRDGGRETEWKSNPVPFGIFKYWAQETLWRLAVVLLIAGLTGQLYLLARRANANL
jgi:hypothetical protein